MKLKTIRQKILFNAPPSEIYEALTNPAIHSQFTGSKATSTHKENGNFTTYDGYAWGKNLLLQKDKKIIQEWTCSDFSEAHKTILKIELVQIGKKTKLVFEQTDVPENQYESIKNGWEEFYWKPLKDFLSDKNHKNL